MLQLICSDGFDFGRTYSDGEKGDRGRVRETQLGKNLQEDHGQGERTA